MNNLNKIAPNLSKIKKGNPFQVPDNYFDSFPDRLNKKIQVGSIDKPSSGNAFIRILKPVLGLAASLALIFLLVYWPLTKFNTDNVVQNNNDIIDLLEMDEYYSLISELDENSLYSIIEGDYENESFTDDELFSYISRSFNEYEIYYMSE